MGEGSKKLFTSFSHKFMHWDSMRLMHMFIGQFLKQNPNIVAITLFFYWSRDHLSNAEEIDISFFVLANFSKIPNSIEINRLCSTIFLRNRVNIVYRASFKF